MTGVEARQIIEDAVRRELFGPLPDEKPVGTPIDCSSGTVRFDSIEASRGQFYDATSLQEVLTQADPLHRYGVGVLYNGAQQHAATTSADPGGETVTWVAGLG